MACPETIEDIKCTSIPALQNTLTELKQAIDVSRFVTKDYFDVPESQSFISTQIGRANLAAALTTTMNNFKCLQREGQETTFDCQDGRPLTFGV